MGTPKRERQKVNRLQRQIEEARAERSSRVKRNALRIGLGALVAIGAVVLIAWLGGAFDSDEEQAVDAPATLPTLDPVPDGTVPPKPEVELPDEPPTELVVTDLVEGDGEPAEVGDTVEVHYVGVRSEDGVEFDNSYDRGSTFPVELGAGQVIDGWEEGLIGVREGGRRQLDIPAELAYGDTGSGDIIGPGDPITFVVDVISITPAGSQ